MDNSFESQMLDSLELFHYASRFRRERFVIVLAPEVDLEPLKLDLRILQTAGINVSILCVDTPDLRQNIESMTGRGAPFVFIENFDLSGEVPKVSQAAVSVFLLPQTSSLEQIIAQRDVFSISRKLGATKTILVSSASGLSVEGKVSSHATLSELEHILDGEEELNISVELLQHIREELLQYGSEIILLGSTPGDLFQEIFTHRGCGTLFSNNYSNVIRPAALADTHQIALLLRPTVQAGTVLPVTEDHIAEHIDQYSVYTVNGEIVALAKLTFFGDSVELGKFATLPRYQGRGRAQELASFLLEQARQSHAKKVFALSTNPAMWRFFEKLGFEKIDRSFLPEDWKRNYDFTRPSVALQLSL